MFPEGFVWGSASSAYQIEGAAATDGRGASVWDTFAAKPGAVFRGHTGEVACDHYHRSDEDIALMSRLGLASYRLSISWTRVMPGGTGAVNAKGLAFYDKLVDKLLAAGIEPWVTLFHWDFPETLYQQGGWLNPDSVKWFADYTKVVVDALSDRVTRWMTINEPQVFIGLGHRDGTHAPGVKLTQAEWLLAGHHVLLSHGRAVRVLRERAKKPAQIGWAPVGSVSYPATGSKEDVDAARQATFTIKRNDTWNNTWWADPVCLGHYPDDGLRVFGADVPKIDADDMELIGQPLDFYGVNIYSGEPVRAGPSGEPVSVGFPAGNPMTSFRWNVAPESLGWGARFLAERYHLPVVITENGMANLDWVSADGAVHDPQRIDFTRRYLLSLAAAIDEGVDVRGYFHWSILDNFEWAEGYRERFGLIHVDFATQKRTLKDSALWYRDVVKSNGGTLFPAGVVIRPPRPAKELSR